MPRIAKDAAEFNGGRSRQKPNHGGGKNADLVRPPIAYGGWPAPRPPAASLDRRGHIT
jgi:hypothetical protein